MKVKIQNRKIYRHFFFILLITFFLHFSCSQKKEENQATGDNYYVAAYIWPSCHHDKRFGNMLWPEGIGEWEIIQKGNPRFEGHYQPRQPLWGYEMDNDPQVMEKWIDTATDHGVNIFVFDWYWYEEGPFLESTLNDGFLKARNNSKMQFYIMWANCDIRKNYLNVHKFENDTSILWKGAVDLANFKTIAKRFIDNYFIKQNYFTINDMPVFYIFDVNNFVKGLGGLSHAKNAIDYFREEAIEAGFPGVHIQVRAAGSMDPNIIGESLSEGKSVNEVIEYLGINSVTKYGWGIHTDYVKLGAETIQKRQKLDSVLNVPYFPNVSIGWDDTPRFPHKTKEDIISYNKSPESFAAYLQKAKEYCDAHPEQEKLITVFSWNEWVEGSYLLPDMKYGFEYLKAVKKVMSGEYNPYPKSK